ncbi:MAG: ribosome small subunit-dependent GTPase A [Lachnospiraceae bacterium]|nr:ribosome small subunit-dependent GTPase A [Lachnospiraceae bacterium]
MQGKIIKGIAGFYYVHAENLCIYECKARGVFRKDNVKPLVGDNVELEVLDQEEKTGNIREILPRKSRLIRPAVANIDQAMVIFAILKPEPNFNLLDRFLIMMEQQNLPCVICFNKSDIASEKEREALQSAYETCGYQVLFISVKEKEGLEDVRKLLQGKTTTVAGPSGVGKSSLINYLQPRAEMETGAISEKIDRGKHTTRHSELFALDKESYIMDTPGFSSLQLFDMEKEELKSFYPEFREHEDRCRFRGCAHISEPGCSVKEALAAGKISDVRYRNYTLLYHELKERRRY